MQLFEQKQHYVTFTIQPAMIGMKDPLLQHI